MVHIDYVSLSQELAINPNWAVRVEHVDDPSARILEHPYCWGDMPTPQAELERSGQGHSEFRRFRDFHGMWNCAANHDTFDKWWPLDELLSVSRRCDSPMQITIIDLSDSPHLKLREQSVINRNNCKVVKSIPLH